MRPTIAAILLSSLTAFPLVACSADDPKPASASSSSHGVDALDKEHFAATVAEAIFGEDSAHMTMLMATPQETIRAEGAMAFGSGDKTAVQMTMDLGGERMEIRIVGSTLYMSQGPDATRWMSYDLESPGLPEELKSLSSAGDLTQQIRQMEAALTVVRQEGETVTIDGVRTTPYVVTLDTRRAMEAEGEDFVAGMPQSIDLVLYLDDRNVMRRMTEDLMGISIRIDVTKLGEPVDIAAPPPAQVANAG